jgi:hypothetical protein
VRRLGYLFLSLLFTSSLSAQTVVVDWIGKNLVSSPARINKKTQARVEVQNVNDILYKYSIQVTGTPRVEDDFSAIAKAFGATQAGEGALVACPVSAVMKAITDLANAVSVFYQLPENQSKSCSKKSPCSINLKDTRTAWKTNVSPKVDDASKALADIQQIPICKNKFGANIDTLQAALNDVNEKSTYLNSDNHVFWVDVTLEPETDYAVDVKELYVSSDSSSGTQTTAPTLSVKFSPGSDQLTLSAGVLFSEIQNRGYTSVSAPTPTGTGTQNVLAVSGMSSLSPLAVGLLNYQIPSFWKLSFANENFGVAVSTGPAVRLGSQSNSSSFGYFVGFGLHLYHRFYISPGIHIGQFADFPPGFSNAGQVVPAGLGTPMPVNRTTARFSFAITYKAKDFSALGLKTTATTTPSPTNANATPAKKTPPAAQGSGGVPAKP